MPAAEMTTTDHAAADELRTLRDGIREHRLATIAERTEALGKRARAMAYRDQARRDGRTADARKGQQAVEAWDLRLQKIAGRIEHQGRMLDVIEQRLAWVAGSRG